jgi:uncharacterized repeat protein (TIGR03806 family)
MTLQAMFPIRNAVSLLALLALLVACGGGNSGGDSGSSDTSSSGGENAAFGLDERVAAIGVQIPTDATGSAALTAVDAFPGLRLPNPTFVTHAGDGSNRLFVLQRAGVISVLSDVGSSPKTATLLDLTPRVVQDGEGGLLGLAFDPSFRSNGYFYVSYVVYDASGARKLRISRFRVSANGANTADVASERIVLDIDHPRSFHFGGWIGFAPDGNLFISHGDGGNDQSVENNPQNRDALFGKILRIRVNADGSHAIPSDNPFGNAVWAMGFRNPWRCSVDRANGNLWCGDVGDSLREEVSRIERASNHGWPAFEGSFPHGYQNNQPFTDFTTPTYEYDHTLGVAVVGGYVYRGRALPDMVGSYLYTDVASANLWALKVDSNGRFVSNTVVAANVNTTFSLGEDEAGELYAASQDGTIYRFVPSSPSDKTVAAIPATLSATGLFTDLAQLTPTPGLVDYEVNSPLWSDGAQKRRWLLLPGNATLSFSVDGGWGFPLGTITVKHFELPQAGGGVTRVETRVMVQRTDGWVGFTYRWREDQRDADLLLDGASAAYDTVNPTTGARTRVNWTFPSQAQCLSCHTQATGRVLGINTLQLNRAHTYSLTGRSDNQLRTWNHLGLFGAGNDIGDAAAYGALPDLANAQASLESRAKAYLDTNCSMCHRPGGTAPVSIDLRYRTAATDMKLVGVPADKPTTPGAMRVVAGNHAASDLWRRVAATDANRMPAVGVAVPDEQALKLLADWIDSTR